MSKMNYKVPVDLAVELMLDLYISSVRESPDQVSEETEDLAYAIIFLVNRFADEFPFDRWMNVFQEMIDSIDQIITIYQDMMVYQAPLYCCKYAICNSESILESVLGYGLSQPSTGRQIFLNYAYLIRDRIHFSHMLRYIRWYCREGKFGAESLLYIFMVSQNDKDVKLEYLKNLYQQLRPDGFPQILEELSLYIDRNEVPRQFSEIEFYAMSKIIDMVIHREKYSTSQLEIAF